jgi:[ribosomal protein S5]-alanine N-acetyltransferase
MQAIYQYPNKFETQRLFIRKLVAQDSVEWAEFYKDAEATLFHDVKDRLSPEESAKALIESQIERYKRQLYGLQALTFKQTGELVGLCGLLVQEINGHKELEIGYHLLRKYWGNGYAGEAASFFKEYAFHNHLSHSVISIIHINNIRSQKVAENNGMKREQRSEWRGKEVFIYRVYNS